MYWVDMPNIHTYMMIKICVYHENPSSVFAFIVYPILSILSCVLLILSYSILCASYLVVFYLVCFLSCHVNFHAAGVVSLTQGAIVASIVTNNLPQTLNTCTFKLVIHLNPCKPNALVVRKNQTLCWWTETGRTVWKIVSLKLSKFYSVLQYITWNEREVDWF